MKVIEMYFSPGWRKFVKFILISLPLMGRFELETFQFLLKNATEVFFDLKFVNEGMKVVMKIIFSNIILENINNLLKISDVVRKPSQ